MIVKLMRSYRGWFVVFFFFFFFFSLQRSGWDEWMDEKLSVCVWERARENDGLNLKGTNVHLWHFSETNKCSVKSTFLFEIKEQHQEIKKKASVELCVRMQCCERPLEGVIALVHKWWRQQNHTEIIDLHEFINCIPHIKKKNIQTLKLSKLTGTYKSCMLQKTTRLCLKSKLNKIHK